MAFKIYTKTGDTGQTALFGGRRVPKSALRVDAYGTVDELNAFIGLLCDQLSGQDAELQVLLNIQNRLFSLGAHLASDPDKKPPLPDLHPEDLSLLETEIDNMELSLEPLKNFILPGGCQANSLAHVCRTICRRAERLVVALNETDIVAPIALQYLNRLSDYFFVLARYLAHKAAAPEIIWNPRKSY